MLADPNLTSVTGNSGTVLVVDDNTAFLDFLLLLFSKYGVNAIGASGGRECLEILQNRTVDAVILDVMMPVMDGLSVCAEVRKIYPATPVILLTARDDMATRSAAMDLGVSEFVAKPVNNKDLLKRVLTQIRTHQWQMKAEAPLAELETPPAGPNNKSPT